MAVLGQLRAPNQSSAMRRNPARLTVICQALSRRLRNRNGAGQVSGGLEPPRGFAGEAKRLESGLRFEVEQGFQNRQGREMQFDAFLVEQLGRVQEACTSSHLRRELRGMREQSKQYAAWNSQQRKEHVEAVRMALSALEWTMQETKEQVMGLHQREGSQASSYTADGASSKPQISVEHIPENGGTAANERLSKVAENGTAMAPPHAALSNAAAHINGQAVANKLVAALSSVGDHKRAQKGVRREAENGQRSSNELPSGLASGSVTTAFDWGQAGRPSQAAERLVNGAQASTKDASPSVDGRAEGNGSERALDEELAGVAARRRSSEGTSTSEMSAGWQQGPREGSRDGYTNGHAVAATNGAVKVDHKSSLEGGESDMKRNFNIGRLDLGLGPSCLSRKYKLIVYDTETTGGPNRVIELGAYAVESQKQFCTLINPSPDTISKDAERVHGISNEEVIVPSVPTFREVGERFIEFVQQQCAGEPDSVPVLLAHNLVSFDHRVMTIEFQKCGLEWPPEWHYIDTVLLARRLFPQQDNSQAGLVERFQIPRPEVAHRAMADVHVLACIVPQLIRAAEVADLDAIMTHPDFQKDHRNGACGTLSDIINSKGATAQEKRKQRFAKAEERRAAAAELAAAIEANGEDPISKVERGMRTPRLRVRKRVFMSEDKASEAVADLPNSWVHILQEPVVKRGILDLQVTTAKSIFTDKQRRVLRDAGFTTVGDVLQYYPRDYLAFGSDIQEQSYVSMLGTVQDCSAWSGPYNTQLSMTVLVDPAMQQNPLLDMDGAWEIAESSLPSQRISLRKVMFGQGGKFTLQKIATDHPKGTEVLLRGKLDTKNRRGTWEMEQNDALEILPADSEPPLVAPIYPAKTPMTPKDFTKVLDRALKALAEADSREFWECLPANICEEQDFMSWPEAVREMHLPSSMDEQEEARRRLAFEELFLLQLTLLLRRELSRVPQDEADYQGAIIDRLDLLREGLQVLPYELTGSQQRTLEQILEDLKEPAPMLRLLQGDVGCGKTVVAFLAMLAAVGSGFQAAMMAPTEVLAEQHYKGLCRLLDRMPEEGRPSVAILTGSTKAKERRELLAALADGSLDLLIGTHALVSDNVFFANLGLAVIDEQHKFGVEQRAKLQAKATPLPHVLAMTATPIPRTLALVAHGDMALCAIDEMPPGRLPVDTTVLQDSPDELEQMFAAVKEEVEAGGRAYIIYPLVSESITEQLTDVKAAEEEFQKLQESEVLGKGVRCGLLHGRLPADEKHAAVSRFHSGETPVLVATSVVEVGMDVSEASIMVVHHAERFGLAQLHQLRGRVGRGERLSRCFLVTAGGPAARQRLDLLAREHSGLQIAEADLAHRGQGDVLGKQQSGRDVLGCLRAAELPRDRLLMEQARQTAAECISRYTLDQRQWPPSLLAALAKTTLPNLDLNHLPLRSATEARS